MKRLSLTAFACASMLFSSCSVYRHSADVTDFSTNAYSDDIYASLSIDTANKVQGISKATFLFNFIQIGGGRDYADIHQVSVDGNPIMALAKSFGNRGEKFRSLALGAAIKGTDYDVILSPRYYTHMQNIFLGIVRTYEVKVVGYGARISALNATPHRYDVDAVIVNGSSADFIPTVPVKVQSAPVAPVQAAPVQATPVQADPSPAKTVAQPAPAQAAPVQPTPVQTAPVPVPSKPAAKPAPTPAKAEKPSTKPSAAPKADARPSGNEAEIIAYVKGKIQEYNIAVTNGANKALLNDIKDLRSWWKSTKVTNQSINAQLASLESKCKANM